MAKINMEIEIDWLDEEMTLDDAVKDSVMRRIEEKVIGKITVDIQESVKEKLTKQADGLISTAIDNEIKTFLTTPRDITDKYGDVKRTQVTVTTLIKEHIDAMMEKKVFTEQGRRDSYQAKYTAFEFFLQKEAKQIINTKVEQMTEAVKKQIETLVSDKIKTHVADNLTNMIMENSTALSLKKGGE